MITNRLDNKEVLDLIDKNKIDKVFLDIDYTVLNFKTGNNKATEKLNNLYPLLGSEVFKIFRLIQEEKSNKDGLSLEKEQRLMELTNEYYKLQNGFWKKYGIKYWSRETMLMIAAKNLRLKLNGDEIEKLTDIYWSEITLNSLFYKDAIPFLDKIKSKNIPIVWVTGSDSRLKIDEVNGEIKLDYDPNYSLFKKSQRLKTLLNKYPGELIIGDPIDKPNIWKNIFDKKTLKNKDRFLVVGDSYNSDIKFAEELEIKTILISR